MRPFLSPYRENPSTLEIKGADIEIVLVLLRKCVLDHILGDSRGAYLLLDLLHELGGLLDHAARVVLALCKSLAVVGEPRSALFDNVARDRKIDDLAALRYSLSVENVEFRHAEGRRFP